MEDLEAAITRLQATVEKAPKDHSDRTVWLNALGNRLNNRYERTGGFKGLEAAINYAEAAVEATPEDHATRARCLSNLWFHFSTRYARTGNLGDLEAAINHAKVAVNATSESITLAAAWLHNLSSHLGHWYGDLWEITTRALRLLELGRSVTSGQLLDYRSDISDLKEQHPALAKVLILYEQELDSPFPSVEHISTAKWLQIQLTAIRRRNKVAKDFDHILQQIRRKPGFQTF
ncbi:hypothetical protein EV426DRAFT_536128 [Tirmania nivea]|nr:hypothetical protein EV426DRAFT_536128 [Tirmania nivea]